jgi:parvulin-like peptidyl-prolyl isomerase
MKIRFSIFKLISVIGAVIVFSGCSKVAKYSSVEYSKPDFPIVIIDTTGSVMASDLYKRLSASGLAENGGILDSTTYFDTLQTIIVDSLVSMEAKNIDLGEDIALYRLYKLRLKDFYLNFLYKNYILDSIKADSADIDSFYRANAQAFSLKEQVQARQLVVSADGLKYGRDSLQYKQYSIEQLDSVAEEMAIRLRNRIDSGEALGNLAYDHSMHRTSGEKNGDLGYFPRNTYNKEFEEQAFSLPEGTISQPFKSPDGWHIVEIIDHIDSGLAPLNEVYPEVNRHYMANASAIRAKTFMDSINAAAEVFYNDSALNKPIAEIPETAWAVIINNIDTITFYRLGDYLEYFRGKMNLPVLDLENKHKILFNDVKGYLVMQAGDKLGFDKDARVAKERQTLYHKYCMDVFKKGRIDANYEPPDSLVREYYQRNIDKYTYKKPIYVQHIITQDSLFGEFLRDQALSGVDFLELAKEHYPGVEEIRTAAADLGYIGLGEMPDNFYQMAMGTAKGDVSHPVKTQWGFHIIKVFDKRYDKTIEQMRGEITGELKIEFNKISAAQWDKNLMARHKLEYRLDRIRKIELPPLSKRQIPSSGE